MRLLLFVARNASLDETMIDVRKEEFRSERIACHVNDVETKGDCFT